MTLKELESLKEAMLKETNANKKNKMQFELFDMMSKYVIQETDKNKGECNYE